MKKAELFAAYGDDHAGALAAWPNLDPVGYRLWSDQAEERQYRAEYRRWSARQVASVNASAIRRESGQARLLDVPANAVESVEIRTTMVHDGTELDVRSLAGPGGAQKLREAALRDLGRAEKTAERCRRNLEVADLIERLSVEQGRPVSVGEALGLAA